MKRSASTHARTSGLFCAKAKHRAACRHVGKWAARAAAIDCLESRRLLSGAVDPVNPPHPVTAPIDAVTVTQSGGTLSTPAIYPLPLSADLNLITYYWENYGIPDEFRLEYNGQRIAGDVGLTSGGHSGKTVFASPNSTATQLTIKVTAPNQGTAWDFSVSASPVELHVDAKLGDVTKVSIQQQFKMATGQSLDSLGLDPKSFQLVNMSNAKGKVAEVDNWQNELKKGIFYFVPKVNGTPLPFNQQHTSDPGLGESELRIRAKVSSLYRPELGVFDVEFPIKFSVIDGKSTAFSDPELMQTVPAVYGPGKTKLDFYRQEQRLAYLGFPGGKNGAPIIVDGTIENDDWSKKVFSIALDPAVSGRGLLPSPTAGTTFFKSHINDQQAPSWVDLSNGTGVTFSSTARTYGVDASGRFIQRAIPNVPADFRISTGVSLINGRGRVDPPGEPSSKTHEGGRSVDIDDGPGDFYEVSGSFMASDGGGFIVKKADGTYRGGGNPNAQAGEKGLTPAQFKAGGKTLAKTLQNLLSYRLAETEVRKVIDAFIAQGSPIVFYNDPRFFDVVPRVQFAEGHYNHLHFAIPSPLLLPAARAASFSPLTGGPLDGATDLGRIEGTKTLSGSVTAAAPDSYYRFEVGATTDDEASFPNQPRDLSVVLSGLTSDADLELLIDPNGDGVGEVYDSSTTAGTANESLTETGLPAGVYYLHVVRKAADTNFNLSINVSPLPVPADNAGNTLATAKNLGDLTAKTANASDFIGEVDVDDFYRFQITQISDLTLSLDGLDQGDASLLLGRRLDPADTDLEPILSSDEEGNASESIQKMRLLPGEYFIHVARSSGDSNYALHVSAVNSTVPPDQAGSTPATAFDLGNISPRTLNDFVGDIDPTDLYKFTVASVTGLTIDLNELSADADLEIYRDLDHDGFLGADERFASSTNADTEAEQLVLGGLSPDTYYIRVGQYEGDTTYKLAIGTQAAVGVDLSLARTAGPATTPKLGDTFTYSVTLKNNGPDTATNIVLNQTIPSGLQLLDVDAVPTGASIQFPAAGFRATLPSLAAGASVTFNVSVYAFQAGRLPVNTTVTTDSADFNLVNNTLDHIEVVDTLTAPPADLELTQSASATNPTIGDAVTLTLGLTNKGPGTATAINVKDLLPAGLTFVSASADIGSYDSTTGIWTVGNMAPGVTVQLRINVTVAAGAPASIVNVAEISAAAEADPDSTPNNNVATEDDQASTTLTIKGVAAATLASVSPSSGKVGQTITVAVVGTNTHFVNGTTTANFGAGITVKSVAVTDATHASITIQIASNAALGSRKVTLTTGSEVAEKSNAFAVQAATFNGAISKLTLINAASDRDLRTLTGGTVIELATIGTTKFNVRADTSGSGITRVVFKLDGKTYTETSAPWALFGNNGNNYNEGALGVGNHTLVVTPYNASGQAGTPTTVQFSVVQKIAPAITSLVLVNADNDRDVLTLSNNQTINLSSLNLKRLNIRAVTNGKPIGSVKFTLDGGYTRMENTAPFAMFGNDGNNYFAGNLRNGTRTITVTPYEKKNGGGTKYASFTIKITVTGAATRGLPPAPFTGWTSRGEAPASLLDNNWADGLYPLAGKDRTAILDS